MKLIKRNLALALLAGAALSFGVLTGCDNGGSNGGSGSTAVGCANLKAGTQCNANKACSNHFLCLTGQGRDKNCSDGCSCQ